MLNASVVVIPLERYEELVRAETRINVLVERLMHSDMFCKEDALWILNTELSVELASELHSETERWRKEWKEKNLEEME